MVSSTVQYKPNPPDWRRWLETNERQKVDFIEPGGPVTKVKYGGFTSVERTRSIPGMPSMNMGIGSGVRWVGFNRSLRILSAGDLRPLWGRRVESSGYMEPPIGVSD